MSVGFLIVKSFNKAFVISAMLMAPVIVSAQIVITEIMYDLEGSDAGREWIELQNTGTADVDIAGWKLYENKTNHALAEVSGGTILPANSYAVIADDADKFLSDWPAFSGILLDSSFSLKNTGETIVLRDGALVDIDTAAYDTELGASGDGNSLQYAGASWIASSPTPGAPSSSPKGEELGAPGPISNNTPTSNAAPAEKLSITADAGGNRAVIAGADVLFKAAGTGTAGEPLDDARYSWNLGDGTVKEGKTVSHIYKYPGAYALVLHVSSGTYTAADRVTITAEPANVTISSAKAGPDGFIELYNKSKKDLNLSFWHLRVDGLHFTFPENSYVLSGTRLIFPYEATNLLVKERSDISLLYPNAAVAAVYGNAAAAPAAAATNRTVSAPRKQKKQEITVPSALSVPANSGNERKEKSAANAYSAETRILAETAGEDERYALSKWLSALAGVMLLAVGAVLYVRYTDRTARPRALAEKIEIMED